MEEDYLGVLAYLEEEAGRCSGCGHPRDEAWVVPAEMTDPWQAHDQQCFACEAIERRRKAKTGEEGMPPGTHIWVTREDD